MAMTLEDKKMEDLEAEVQAVLDDATAFEEAVRNMDAVEMVRIFAKVQASRVMLLADRVPDMDAKMVLLDAAMRIQEVKYSDPSRLS